MAFGSEVDDAVHVFFLHQSQHSLKVADVHLHEAVVGLVLDVFEVSQIACVGEFVEVDNPVFGVLVHKQTYHMATDKTGTSGDDNAFHRTIGF